MREAQAYREAGRGIMNEAPTRMTPKPLTLEVVSPMPNKYTTPNIAERFWTKVYFTDTCWLWTAANSGGYGQFSVSGHWQPAHRWAYEFCIGPIPDGLEIDHLCLTAACVYPWHLEPVTHLENVRRGRAGQWERDKTHCPQGHPYDEANTIVRPRGSRECRTCTNKRNFERWHHDKAREIEELG